VIVREVEDELEVANDRAGTGDGDGSEHGLIGMRDRVHLRR